MTTDTNTDNESREIGIGIIGAGYMGKTHSVAMQAVASVFDTALRPRCEMICTTTPDGAKEAARKFGFNRYTADWTELVTDERVDAIVIASPQFLHREIAVKAFELRKPVLCEKPLGASLDDSRAMVEAAKQSGVVNMVGFNYGKAPATQYVKKLLESGEIGDVTWFRGEHTEDFLHDPAWPATWRTTGKATGTMGDLAPHMISCAMNLMGPIERLSADIETVHHERPTASGGTQAITNDDHAHFTCRFSSGVMGHLYFSRIATGRKMGYAYEIMGTKGGIRFDQEDQNAIWLYRATGDNASRGYTKILTGPDHPDYVQFCLGPGHGTGYQDTVIIEARDFLEAIAGHRDAWPPFTHGMEVNQVIEAAHDSASKQAWVAVADY